LQEAFDVAVGQLAETTRTELGKQIGVDLASLNGFELGVVLAHEAMRNGQKDGEVEQVLETRNSVLAHSDHALQVLEKYGPGALNRHMSQEALIYSMVQNGEISKEAFKAYVDETYDSSSDFYWKLSRDGVIEWIEDDTRSEGSILVETSGATRSGNRLFDDFWIEDTDSAPLALFRLLGNKVEDVFRRNSESIHSYKKEVIMDVLGVSEERYQQMRDDDAIWQLERNNATEDQLNILMGEMLMREGRLSLSSETERWSGELTFDLKRIYNTSLKRITNNNSFRDLNSDELMIGIHEELDEETGYYDKFVFFGELTRSEGAYDLISWNYGDENSAGGWTQETGRLRQDQRDNSSFFINKWYLGESTWRDPTSYDQIEPDGRINSVDNTWGNLPLTSDTHLVSLDQLNISQSARVVLSFLMNGSNPEHIPTDLRDSVRHLQGNTIVDDFTWTAFNDTQFYNNDSDLNAKSFLQSNTRILSGEYIDQRGVREFIPFLGTEARWLGHKVNFGTSDGCVVIFGTTTYRNSDPRSRNPDLENTGARHTHDLMKELFNDYDLYDGLDIRMILNDENDWVNPDYFIRMRRGDHD
jgi:hypothetical protein